MNPVCRNAIEHLQMLMDGEMTVRSFKVHVRALVQVVGNERNLIDP
jgi:hypothetical protein